MLVLVNTIKEKKLIKLFLIFTIIIIKFIKFMRKKNELKIEININHQPSFISIIIFNNFFFFCRLKINFNDCHPILSHPQPFIRIFFIHNHNRQSHEYWIWWDDYGCKNFIFIFLLIPTSWKLIIFNIELLKIQKIHIWTAEKRIHVIYFGCWLLGMWCICKFFY